MILMDKNQTNALFESLSIKEKKDLVQLMMDTLLVLVFNHSNYTQHEIDHYKKNGVNFYPYYKKNSIGDRIPTEIEVPMTNRVAKGILGKITVSKTFIIFQISEYDNGDTIGLRLNFINEFNLDFFVFYQWWNDTIKSLL